MSNIIDKGSIEVKVGKGSNPRFFLPEEHNKVEMVVIDALICAVEHFDGLENDDFNFSIIYDLGYQRFFGQAKTYRHDPSKAYIRLNPFLLREVTSTYMDTVLHEVAHIVARTLSHKGVFPNSIKPHGREFQQVCAVIGAEAGATTDRFKDTEFEKERQMYKKMRATEKRSRVFYYECGCDTLLRYHELSIRRHNSIQRGLKSYSCKRCKETIVFVKEKEYDFDLENEAFGRNVA